MELIEKMREEASSGHVAYTEFILKQKKRKDCIFCFFEGNEDNKYYGIRIESTTKSDYETIVCRGKENVLIAQKLISKNPEYNRVLQGYFIDQDYDEPININKIYCLPAYSIENQYANRNVLKKILQSEFLLDIEDVDYIKTLDIFEELQNEFHTKTAFLNAWLACQNDKRKQLGIKTHLKIDSTIGKFFSSIINENLELVLDLSDIDTLEKLQSHFPDSPVITNEEIDEKLISFKDKNLEFVYRGKFQMRFFISFLDRLKSEICKKRPEKFEMKHKCSLRFEYPTSLTNLSIYAETPRCLYEYLQKVIKNAA